MLMLLKRITEMTEWLHLLSLAKRARSAFLRDVSHLWTRTVEEKCLTWTRASVRLIFIASSSLVNTSG